MKKTLLIIGAGVEQVPAIQLARKKGLNVIAVDGNPKAPGFAYAHGHAVISTYDITKNVAFAREYSRKKPVHGVMTIASDIPQTVAAVSKALKLPGLSLRTAKLASHKLLMKDCFKKHGVAIPVYAKVANAGQLKAFIRKHGFAVVIKPVDSRGARGVLRLTAGMDLKAAFDYSKSFSPSGSVIAEKFIPGMQLSTESIIFDGKIMTCGIARRNYEYLDKFAPYIIENGGDLPVDLSARQRQQLDQILYRAACALGLKRGSLKGDVVLTAYGPVIIEVAARLSGGWLATHEIPLSTGVDMVYQVMRMALGYAPDLKALTARYHKAVAIRYIFAQEGTIRKITGVSAAKRMPGVQKIGINLTVGSKVDKISDHTKRAGFVITCASTRQQAIKQAQNALKRIHVWQN